MFFVLSPSQNFADAQFCQIAAAIPVAALTVHWTVIHYRDCASLTLVRGGLCTLHHSNTFSTRSTACDNRPFSAFHWQQNVV